MALAVLVRALLITLRICWSCSGYREHTYLLCPLWLAVAVGKTRLNSGVSEKHTWHLGGNFESVVEKNAASYQDILVTSLDTAMAFQIPGIDPT